MQSSFNSMVKQKLAILWTTDASDAYGAMHLVTTYHVQLPIWSRQIILWKLVIWAPDIAEWLTIWSSAILFYFQQYFPACTMMEMWSLMTILGNKPRVLVLPRSRPMFFEKIEFWMPRKLAKTVRIFVEIEHIENWGVTFLPKKFGPVFPMLWSSHEFSHKTMTELVTAS